MLDGTSRSCVTCILGADADLFHVAMTVTGLCELASQNLIELKLKQSSSINRHALVLEIGGRSAGIDLSDHSDQMMPELSGCDLLVKRCVRPEILTASSRIRPFGLNYACRSRRSTLKLLGLFGLIDGIRRSQAWKKLLCVPLVAAFERAPEVPASRRILIQARLWSPDECLGDEGVNEERVRLLRALQREFKERVVGGLVPTAFARRHYPELITCHPTRQSQYVRWAKEPLISIGFRGLFGSIGFKIAEAFAAAQCLIFEETTATMPADAPVLRYQSVEECLTICDRLLTNPSEATALRNQAWEYYRSSVEPSAHVRNLLSLIQ